MKNKNLAVLGLFYTHSFKKIMLTVILYLIACLSLSFIMFSQNYLGDTEYMGEFFTSTHFTYLTLAFFFFVFYSVRNGSSTIFSKERGVLKRMDIRNRNVLALSYLYFIIILIIAYSTIMINFYAMIKFFLAYFDYGYYNRPFIFGKIANSSFFYSIMPYYSLSFFFLKVIVILVTEFFIIIIQSKSKTKSYADIFIALAMSFFIIYG